VKATGDPSASNVKGINTLVDVAKAADGFKTLLADPLWECVADNSETQRAIDANRGTVVTE
jgi:hypothetical protein